MSFGRANEELNGWGMWHGRGTAEVHTRVLVGDPREGDDFEDLGIEGRIILK